MIKSNFKSDNIYPHESLKRIILILLLILTFISCKKKTPSPKEHTIRYEVTDGNKGLWASMKYSSGNATIDTDYSQIDYKKSWTREVTLKTGDRVYFSAQAYFETISFVINVYIDGQLSKTARQTFKDTQYTSSPIGPGPEIDFTLN